MEPGEEYLTIKLDAKEMLWRAHEALVQGRDKIQTAAFYKKDRTSESQPVFKGRDVAIWRNKKGQQQNQETQQKVEEETVQ